jgi:nucleotide-binding universal stress UspA family protein
MKALLVLTDFSHAADTAAAYACGLAMQLNIQKIILYHSYRVTIPVSEAVVLVPDEEESRSASLLQLKKLKKMLEEKKPAGIELSCRTDALGLSEINTLALEEGATMIVMGTTGKTKLEEVLLGSNAIAVCKESNYPVLLVPDHVLMQPVHKIIFACDMKEVEKTIPVEKLKMILDTFKVPLTILNVDDADKHFTADTPMNTMALHNMLEAYNPEYYNISSADVADGIIRFANLRPATIVLLVSKRHNFLEGIFYSSLTRKLANETSFPLMVLHELESRLPVINNRKPGMTKPLY